MDRTTEPAEIERLKVAMAHYCAWGDTQQWDKLATLLHDYLKAPVVDFKGGGHMLHDYVKVDGEWKIRKLHTTRTIVGEEWL
jgi:hypothetical protein